jgi:putative addiction module component (TIGR02574 family)
MSIAPEEVAGVLALPEQDRAFLAHQLIASLDNTADADAEAQWNEVIDRRSREIEEGRVTCRPVEQVIQDIRQCSFQKLGGVRFAPFREVLKFPYFRPLGPSFILTSSGIS